MYFLYSNQHYITPSACVCWLSLSQPTVEPVSQTDGKQSCLQAYLSLVIQGCNLTQAFYCQYIFTSKTLPCPFFYGFYVFCLNWVFVMLLVLLIFLLCKLCRRHTNPENANTVVTTGTGVSQQGWNQVRMDLHALHAARA